MHPVPRSAPRLLGLRTLAVLGLAAALTGGCDASAWCERFKLDCDAQGGVQVPNVVDLDADGFSPPEDCDDTNGLVHPLAMEICDGLDNDCDGQVDEGTPGIQTWYLDLDEDGFGSDDDVLLACVGPQRYVLQGGDCNDRDSNIHPGAIEVCDGLDNDCDGEVDEDLGERALRYRDSDGDGYGVDSSGKLVCGEPEGWTTLSGDCDDSDPAVSPGAEEICNNEIDDNCDGLADPCIVRSERSLSPSDGLLLLTSAEAAVGTIMVEQWDRASEGAIAVGSPDHGVGGEVFILPFYRISPTSGLEPSRGTMKIDAEGARLGAALAPTGHLVGDYGLLAVGAPGYAGDSEDAGLVLMASFEGAQEVLADYSGSYMGETAGMELGASLVTVGDPTASSLLVAGAPGADDGEGAVFLFNDFTSYGAYTTKDAITVLRAGSAQPGFGRDLSSGDLDGDGVTNVLAGSDPEADAAAPLWLFFSFGVEGEVLATDAAVAINPLGSADGLGPSRSLFMDVDSDGTDDLVLGGPGAEDGRGSVWVIPGGFAAEELLRDEGLDGAAVRIDGLVDGEALGSSLAMAKLDEPSNPTPWLMIGAPGDEASGSDGAVAFFLTPIAGTLDSAAADGSIRMAAGLGFGQSGTLLPVRDLSGDERPDLVFGLPGHGFGDLLLLVTPNL